MKTITYPSKFIEVKDEEMEYLDASGKIANILEGLGLLFLLAAAVVALF